MQETIDAYNRMYDVPQQHRPGNGTFKGSKGGGETDVSG